MQGQRAGNRLRLDMSGLLELTQGNRSCHVANVSSGGAMIITEGQIATGCPAILHIAERTIFATVVWSRSQFAGLRFTQPLALEEMQRFLWIVQNRDEYQRSCDTSAAAEWCTGSYEDPTDNLA